MNSRLKLVVVTSSTLLVVLLLLGAAAGTGASSPDDAYRHLAVYSDVLSRIKSDYVEEPDIKNVTLGAMNGMLEAIDPFASYLSADQYKQYLRSQDAKKVQRLPPCSPVDLVISASSTLSRDPRRGNRG